MGFYDYMLEARIIGFTKEEFLEMTCFDFLFERIVNHKKFQKEFILNNSATIQLLNVYVKSKGGKENISINDFLGIEEQEMPNLQETEKFKKFKEETRAKRKGVYL